MVSTPERIPLTNGENTDCHGNDDTIVAIERETWGRKLEFILTCVGYCVGLGNVWRFPYLAFSNGGGAFLIPYIIMLLVCGMPIFLMELALGQYFRLGPVSTWNLACPLGKGIGYAMIAVSFLCTIYYNVIIAWVIYFVYASMRNEVPWKSCGNTWNTPACAESGKIVYNWRCLSTNQTWLNYTTSRLPSNTSMCERFADDPVSPSTEYWERRVLKITRDLGDSGEIQSELLICLALAWTLVFVCLFKGIQTSGKVVYFTATFPYVVMVILLIRGCILEGAGEGIRYYLMPSFEKLKDANVWVAAATQIFYSLGIGFGSLIAFGSYNKVNNNIIRDAVSLSLTNCVTSVMAGFVVFSVLGHMAHKSGLSVPEVATQGPGLIFVVYPEGLAQMPVTSLWGILFFLMILMIGVDTQFAMMEAVIVGFIDEYKTLHKHKTLFIFVVCVVAMLIGISMVTQGGMYVLNLFNWQSGGVSLLFLAFFEVIAIAYGYGADRFEKDLETILGRKPSVWWKICWKYISPFIILAILISSLVQWSGVTYGKYSYPAFGEAIGWLLALFSMMWIPVVAIYKMCCSVTGSFYNRLRQLLTPNMDELQRIAVENKMKVPSAGTSV